MKEKTQQNSTDSTLSPKQFEVIEALARGASVTKTADMAGVDRSTIYLWRKDNNFEAALNIARCEFADTTRARLRELVDEAVNTVRDVLQNPEVSAAVRLMAALSVLQSVGELPEYPGDAAMIQKWRQEDARQRIIERFSLRLR